MALRARVRSDNTWPGFVDALSTLLLAIIFLLVVFVLSHFVLNQALTGRDEELSRLNRQIAELSELLALEQEATSEMRTTVSQLSVSLQESTRARDLLSLRIDDLTLEIDRLTARAEQAEGELLAARQLIEADRDKIELQLREFVSLRRDIEALRQVRAALEQRVADLVTTVEARDQEIGALRDRTKQLQAEVASEEERTLLAQREIEARDVRIEELVVQANLAREEAAAAQQEAASERDVSVQARSRIDLLNQQIAALRQQLLRLEAALEASEARDKEQQTTIADLGRRLNVALARRVEELSKYRSEFFGRLREVLGDRADITVVGDRFVFQSEVLFQSGSADLGQEGQVQLSRFAETLREISTRIPADIPWIIRVDGHTDVRPIFTTQFPSNWELSTARAIAVTRFLQARGIPPERLAAAGFGEFQPLDPRRDEIAFRRNRRIELKLTER